MHRAAEEKLHGRNLNRNALNKPRERGERSRDGAGVECAGCSLCETSVTPSKAAPPNTTDTSPELTLHQLQLQPTSHIHRERVAHCIALLRILLTTAALTSRKLSPRFHSSRGISSDLTSNSPPGEFIGSEAHNASEKLLQQPSNIFSRWVWAGCGNKEVLESWAPLSQFSPPCLLTHRSIQHHTEEQDPAQQVLQALDEAMG